MNNLSHSSCLYHQAGIRELQDSAEKDIVTTCRVRDIEAQLNPPVKSMTVLAGSQEFNGCYLDTYGQNVHFLMGTNTAKTE